jgi:hypothetical protein
MCKSTGNIQDMFVKHAISLEISIFYNENSHEIEISWRNVMSIHFVLWIFSGGLVDIH